MTLPTGDWKIAYILVQKNQSQVREYGLASTHPAPHKGDSFQINGRTYTCTNTHIDFDHLTISIYGEAR